MPGITRRGAAVSAAAALLSVRLVRPAAAQQRASLSDAVRAHVGEAGLREGRVSLDIPPLVENGNAVPLSVVVDSPMTPVDFVRSIAVFNERNPQPHVVTAQLGPRAGQARLATRIRLATSQRLVAVAEMSDGSFWSGSADVVVTLAACVEG